MQDLIAPIHIGLTKKRKLIKFEGFFIRKIKESEKLKFTSLNIGNTWQRAEIQNSSFCLTRSITDNNDWVGANNFQQNVKKFRIVLRLIGCNISLSVYSTCRGVICAGDYTQAELVNDACILRDRDIVKMKKIYKYVEQLVDDKKFESIFQRYECAISANQFPANKFIDAVTVLEALILPGKNRGELNARLSIIISNLLFKEFKENKKITFSKIKDYYDIRSDFVHSGVSSKYTKDKMEDVLLITRKILLLYVTKKNMFEEKNLENLLIS